jgi:beta-alanine degradation protein BauB
MGVETVEEGGYDVVSFTDELAAAPQNLAVGTSRLFENGHVRVWEVRLAPGERTPFHAHTVRYFWTCVDPGLGRQRYADGTMKVLRYGTGDTFYSEHTPEAPMLHDLENVGDTQLRFLTVEILG